MAGLSLLPPSPSVWTPDFPRRRPPSPRNLPANPIRGTITTNFGAVVRGVRPPPTPFRELLLEMDTAGLLLNREYYLSSTFLRSLILFPLFLPFFLENFSFVAHHLFPRLVKLCLSRRGKVEERERIGNGTIHSEDRILIGFFFFSKTRISQEYRDWMKVMSV